MKQLMMLFVVCALLVGCASKEFVPPEVCDNQESHILEVMPNPTGLDKALLGTNLGAMEMIEGYGPKEALAVIDQVDEKVNSVDMTYAELVGYIMRKVEVANGLAGASIFIVGPDLRRLASPLPVSRCDIELVRRHLERQRVLVQLYGAGSG